MIEKKAGVYQILCIENGNMYIGSSSNLYTRNKSHFSQLRRGVHHCDHLQKAFNKYGSDKFQWNILEYCPLDFTEKQLCEREQEYLDRYWPTGKLYNPNPRAETAGRKASDETRAKLIALQNSPERKARQSKALTGRKHTPESYANLIAAQRNPETKAKQSLASKIANSDPERRAKRSALMTGRKHSEDARAKMSAIQQDPERRSRQSEKLKGRRLTDEQLANLKNAVSTPEYKDEKRYAMKKRWEDPEYRKRMTETSASRKHTPEELAKMKESQNRPEVKSRKAKGDEHPNSKLKPDDVIEIRRIIANGTMSKTAIAERYNVSIGLISAIAKRRAWKHI